MEVKDFYEALGADYNVIIGRLRKDDRIKKYLLLFLKDDNFSLMCQAVETMDYEKIFATGHTLKGMSMNLELTPLVNAVVELVEYVRPGVRDTYDDEKIKVDFQKIADAYQKTVNLIEQL
ncbi:Hpt domain-containing protein [Sporofaciens sp. SGI.106]|uniref:Hpt domain-containing protein n=1 Tax=Sporofaciens sp. SGI.106 TaxID=3420568 RepID=UPI002A984A4A|nr:Hpt domain-containing protein [Lachnoclostridium sp.]